MHPVRGLAGGVLRSGTDAAGRVLRPAARSQLDESHVRPARLDGSHVHPPGWTKGALIADGAGPTAPSAGPGFASGGPPAAPTRRATLAPARAAPAIASTHTGWHDDHRPRQPGKADHPGAVWRRPRPPRPPRARTPRPGAGGGGGGPPRGRPARRPGGGRASPRPRPPPPQAGL